MVKGCHLFGLLGGAGLAGFDALWEVPISVGGPSWKDTFRLSGEEDEVLDKSWLASGLGGRGGGAIIIVSTRVRELTGEEHQRRA